MIDVTIGQTVKDRITEVEGIAIARCDYISGCRQILVQPKGLIDGKKQEAEWFDVQRLELVGNEVLELDNVLVPGFDKLPPKR